MAQDKLIKTGQLTFARLLFLVFCGALLFAFVALGGKFLTVGYFLVTLAICVLLFLIAIDYGVKIEKVTTSESAATPVLDQTVPVASTTPTSEIKIKRRVNKAVKRRR
jgi:hypothetical protein